VSHDIIARPVGTANGMDKKINFMILQSEVISLFTSTSSAKAILSAYCRQKRIAQKQTQKTYFLVLC